MSMFVLVPGAWHGSWAWERVVPLLAEAGREVFTVDLEVDAGLREHARAVADVLGTVGDADTVLVGHSYAGLVVREAADMVPERVGRVVLVDGWAGPDGADLLSLAGAGFASAMAGLTGGDGFIAAPPPQAFGVTDPADAAWLGARLGPQKARSFSEPTVLSGAVDAVPGTGVFCRPETYPFADMAKACGYDVVGVDAAHDVMLTDPVVLAEVLLRLG